MTFVYYNNEFCKKNTTKKISHKLIVDHIQRVEMTVLLYDNRSCHLNDIKLTLRTTHVKRTSFKVNKTIEHGYSFYISYETRY